MFEPGDGCTLWPDGWGAISWRHCCDVHDIAYQIGSGKAQADLELAWCVANSGAPIMGLIMLAGLTIGGWFFYYVLGRRPLFPDKTDDKGHS